MDSTHFPDASAHGVLPQDVLVHVFKFIPCVAAYTNAMHARITPHDAYNSPAFLMCARLDPAYMDLVRAENLGFVRVNIHAIGAFMPTDADLDTILQYACPEYIARIGDNYLLMTRALASRKAWIFKYIDRRTVHRFACELIAFGNNLLFELLYPAHYDANGAALMKRAIETRNHPIVRYLHGCGIPVVFEDLFHRKFFNCEFAKSIYAEFLDFCPRHADYVVAHYKLPGGNTHEVRSFASWLFSTNKKNISDAQRVQLIEALASRLFF